MSGSASRRRVDLLEVALYAGVFAASVVVLVTLAGFDQVAIPFRYAYDALFTGAMIKGLIQNGWYLVNPYLGAPGVMQLADYPISDILSFGVMKVISWAAGDWASTMNLFFLFGFPAAALTALWVLRKLGLDRIPAAVAALLFAFLPLHFERGTEHLFLSAYYVVPLAVLVSVWMIAEEPPAFGRSAGRFWMDSKGAAALGIAVLAAASGTYYAFFASFFIFVAAVVGSVRNHKRTPLASGAVVIAAIIGASAVALSPTFIYWASAGRNPFTAYRTFIQAEIYGLKLDALFLPVIGHRVPAMAAVTADYLQTAGKVGWAWATESEGMAGLGIVLGLGLICLLGWLFVGGSDWAGRALGSRRTLMGKLAVLTVAGVLLGTVGGVSEAIALIVPQIRAYNRISVFLAFFAAVAVALVLEAVSERLGRRWGAWVGVALVLVVGLFGLLDQVPPMDLGAQAAIAAQYTADQRFVASIEQEIGPRKAVFQLPWTAFPEVGTVNGMSDYQQFRAYLHSTTTRWSYAAVYGRPTAAWQENVAKLPLGQMAAELKRNGFSGIWIDLSGYPDGGTAVRAEAQTVFGSAVRENETREFLFVPIK